MDLLSFDLFVLPNFKDIVILNWGVFAGIQRKVFLRSFLSEHARLQLSDTELIISNA